MTQRTIHQTIAATSLVTLLPAAIAWAGIQPEPFRTGLFGVTAWQSIRISVVNAGDAGGTINPCFRVWDVTGALLFETDGGPLPAGVGTFVDFNPFPPTGGPPPPIGTRAQLRAEVELLPAVQPGDSSAVRSVLRPEVHVTLEVFDTATGQTVYTTPFAAVAGIEPEPFAEVAGVEPTPFAEVAGIEPVPFRTGLFGSTAGQSIRINVLNAGDAGGIINPCFRVWDVTGALLFETDGGPLPAGVGTFVDFNPFPPTGGPPPPVGTRAQLRAEVELLPAVQPGDSSAVRSALRPEVHVTLEVFDTATGQTVYTMPFAAVAGVEPEPFRVSAR